MAENNITEMFVVPVREIEIKPNLRFHIMLARRANINKTAHTNAEVDTRKREASFTVGIDWHSLFEDQCGELSES